MKLLCCAVGLAACHARAAARVEISGREWRLNGAVTYPGSPAEGLLMNVRMVNAVFEDANPATCPPGFAPEANTAAFLARVPDYVGHGIRAFTISLQGGSCGYEGAVNSAFAADGSLREPYLRRVRRVVEACDRAGAAVILTCYYQRQDQILRDETAVRAGVVNVAKWVRDSGYTNVLLEIANEFGHGGFDHGILQSAAGQAGLIRLARETAPQLQVGSSGPGSGALAEAVAQASDFLLVHFNNTRLDQIPERIAALQPHGKPIVCNEDEKPAREAARAAELCVARGASWGLMLVQANQSWPFTFRGAADAPDVYATLQHLTTPDDYFPPPESAGGWRRLETPDEIRKTGGMDPAKLEALREWLRQSDDRNFAAVVIRRGWIVLEVERGNSARTDARRVASVSKAVCATVLAIASEQSQAGLTPRRMQFDDRAFDFIPQAQPLSDPRKAEITVQQLLNHTSGISPEATGSRNDGAWEYILGHTGDERTAKLAFAPGAGCGYSTHALHHAALVCENVTGKPYDEFAVAALFQPLGIGHWTFSTFDGDAKHGRHTSHSLGMPARDLARLGWCMLRHGRWAGKQVIPEWFVRETAAPTHTVTTPELRWGLNPAVFSHGWELPARHDRGGRSGAGIPAGARAKPGSGGQIMAFVPGLDLVITRQTGSSGDWQYEEYLRRACAAVIADHEAK